MARLGNGSITSIDGADTDAVDAFLMYHAAAGTDIKEREISREELAAAMVAEGLVQENDDGEIVGPIVLSTYANNAAAGTPAIGVIFLVGGELRVGDGATQGGLAYLPSAPEFAAYSTDTSVTLDVNKSGITSFLLDGAGTDLTLTNPDDMPLGYKFDVVIYATTGQTLKVKVNDAAVYDQLSLTAGADGFYAYTFMKVTETFAQGDWIEFSYKFTATFA